ncbi:hypothetical protein CNMCM5623_002937 [Aspergillus felis]|uniref:Major facilitator superfamily (MFS) profile domain-containing protein n=1 Tax=Aspergillus felis TaxID=1287682 RepID=A0A8H6QB69_9EURO|nr:hypothetical protein CNMCM5623_002937 [Aspergillus felis]
MTVAISNPAAPPVSARAYLSVTGGTCALLCTVGFVVAFGVFQGYYTEHLFRGMSEFDISWIGSASIFLLYVSAPICGVLVDRFGPKVIIMCPLNFEPSFTPMTRHRFCSSPGRSGSSW